MRPVWKTRSAPLVSGSTALSLSRADAYEIGRAILSPYAPADSKAILFGSLRRFSFCFFISEAFGTLGLSGKHIPCRLRPTATLTHMVERRRLRFVPRLLSAGQKELKIGVSGDWCGQLVGPPVVLCAHFLVVGWVLAGWLSLS